MARFVGRLAATLVCTTFVTVQFPTRLGQAQVQPQDIGVYAQKITVRIDGQQEGSGFIIEKAGNTYTVLTNWHVVDEAGRYSVTTVDGQKHNVNYRSVQQLPGLDAARLQFESSRNYEQADFGNSDEISPGQQVFFAGYPKEIKGEPGRNYTFQTANITRILSRPKEQGYAIVHDGNAFPGMSGGPVLNSNNNVIGIHGQAGLHSGTRAVSLYAIPINIARSKLDDLPLPAIAESPVLERRNNNLSPAPENNIESPILEREIIAEINRVRANPRGYANELAQLRQYYDGKDLTLPGRATVQTEEGVEALNEAIDFLRSTNPLPSLRFSAELSMAATYYAQNQDSTEQISDTGDDVRSLMQRANDYGQVVLSSVGIVQENKTAQDLVRELIVGDSYPDHLHRRVIFYPSFRFTGVGCEKTIIYGNICLVIYAEGFTESTASRNQLNTTSTTQTETNTERETAETTTNEDNVIEEENEISLDVDNVLRLPLRRNGVLEEGDNQLPSDKSLYDTYAFAGREGQLINISLESRDFDTYMMLIDPNYTQIAENDDISQENRNSAISIRLSRNGTYVVLVNSVDGSGRGRYTLTVNER